MTAHRIWISSGQQLEDEIWADSQRCQDAIAELLQPGSPDTVVSYGAVPGGTETNPLDAPPYAAQCPECSEAAIRQAPADLVPWEAHGLERPRWSHADQSALCPVIRPGGGYQPAPPRRAEPQPEPGPNVARLDPPATMRAGWPAPNAQREAEPG